MFCLDVVDDDNVNTNGPRAVHFIFVGMMFM